MKYFFTGLQFLTRISIVKHDENFQIKDFGLTVPYFPFIGALIGFLCTFTYILGYHIFSPSIAALLVVISQILITGGLHADGYMDTCDGLFSGRTKERKLEIMKDSHVGSNAVVGFLFLVLLKWQFLASLPYHVAIFVIFIISVFSKYGMVLSICRFPYARLDGLGKAFSEYAPTTSVYTTTLYTLLIGFLGSFIMYIYLSTYIFFSSVFLLFICQIFVNTIINRYCTKHLGGVTGDTYGFVSECTELVLVSISVIYCWYI